MQRRLFLKSSVASGVAVVAASAGLLTPVSVFAASGDFKAISDKRTASAAGAAKGSFKFKAPAIAENGAVVPLEVDASKMSDVTNISFLVTKNTTPLSGSYNFSGGALGFVAVRVKMGQSSPITALVTAGGKSSAITKEVKVTIGGCGG
jgi:sulfur-oxidizing protein SoxY